MAIIESSCLWCAKQFFSHKWENQIYCSLPCSLRHRNITNNPSKSEGARKKNSEWHKKHPIILSKEARDKQRHTISGDGHWNWQGGKTPENRARRNQLEFKLWRKAIFERDNYTCQICGERGATLNADHIKPWSLYPNLRYELSNGRTLCVDCHKNTPTYMGRIKRFMGLVGG